MKKKPLISSEELDRIFDEGEEDIIEYLDFSTARRPGLEANKIAENYRNQRKITTNYRNKLEITTKEYLECNLVYPSGLKVLDLEVNETKTNMQKIPENYQETIQSSKGNSLIISITIVLLIASCILAISTFSDSDLDNLIIDITMLGVILFDTLVSVRIIRESKKSFQIREVDD
ncbi:MAG: hypothetical protein AB4063_26030 [Crocosphaera sp.]